jgi:DNA polymerase I-like protein with 3'-5' exonuclease and polymerase domains
MTEISLSSTSDNTNIDVASFMSKAILCDLMSVDTETNAKDIRTDEGICIGISAAIRYNGVIYGTYIPVGHTENNVTEEVKEFFFKLLSTKIIIFHNAKFDLDSLKRAGYNLGYRRWYCTMMMAHFLNENVPKGLDWLAKNELKLDGKQKSEEWRAWFTLVGWSPDFPVKVMAEYATWDAVLTLMLFFKLYPLFVKSGFDGSEVRQLQ